MNNEQKKNDEKISSSFINPLGYEVQLLTINDIEYSSSSDNSNNSNKSTLSLSSFIERINFLWKSSHMYIKSNSMLSKHFAKQITILSITQMISLPKWITDVICEGCGEILIPGETSSIRIQSRDKSSQINKHRRRKKMNLYKNEFTNTCHHCSLSKKIGGTEKVKIDQTNNNYTNNSDKKKNKNVNNTNTTPARKQSLQSSAPLDEFISLDMSSTPSSSNNNKKSLKRNTPPEHTPKLLLDSKPRKRKKSSLTGGQGNNNDNNNSNNNTFSHRQQQQGGGGSASSSSQQSNNNNNRKRNSSSGGLGGLHSFLNAVKKR